jgi:hypothetical protein
VKESNSLKHRVKETNSLNTKVGVITVLNSLSSIHISGLLILHQEYQKVLTGLLINPQAPGKYLTEMLLDIIEQENTSLNYYESNGKTITQSSKACSWLFQRDRTENRIILSF